MDLISVIVPVYNAEKYLKDCLNSIVSQSYSNIEILIVNDGSTDSSLSICEEFQRKDSRIKIVSQLNSGVSSARNVGVNLARGKYISFVDSDDLIHPDFLSVLYKSLIANQADMAVCGFGSDIGITEKKTTRLQLVKLSKNETLIKQFVRDSSFGYANWNKLYKSEILKKLIFPNFSVGEDYALNYDYISRINSSVFIDSKLYFYRLNELGISRIRDFKKDKIVDNISSRFYVYSREQKGAARKQVLFQLEKTLFSSLSLALKSSKPDYFLVKSIIKRYKRKPFCGKFTISENVRFLILFHFPGIYMALLRRKNNG